MLISVRAIGSTWGKKHLQPSDNPNGDQDISVDTFFYATKATTSLSKRYVLLLSKAQKKILKTPSRKLP